MLNKAASKASELAGQAAVTAAQWYRLDAEQRRLAKLRAEALQTRAQIGEEMYKLWQTGALPPSSLDDLFRDVARTMAAIDVQRDRVDDLRAHFTEGALPADPVTILDGESHLQVVAGQLPPPVVPAATTRQLAAPEAPVPGTATSDAEAPCPRCGRPGPSGKPFCGYCGARLI